MVQVRKGLCCWGLRELIGHPPFLADWKSCRWRSNCTGAWLLMPCSLGSDCPASHISAQPVWGHQGEGREEVTETAYNSASGPHMGSHGWGVVKEGGETSDLPSLSPWERGTASPSFHRNIQQEASNHLRRVKTDPTHLFTLRKLCSAAGLGWA